MSVDRLVFAFAGTLFLNSLMLVQIQGRLRLWLVALVGANPLQAFVAGFGPAASILRKLGAEFRAAFAWSGPTQALLRRAFGRIDRGQSSRRGRHASSLST